MIREGLTFVLGAVVFVVVLIFVGVPLVVFGQLRGRPSAPSAKDRD